MSIALLKLPKRAKSRILAAMSPDALFLLWLSAKRMRVTINLEMIQADNCHWAFPLRFTDIPMSVTISMNRCTFWLSPYMLIGRPLPLLTILDGCYLMESDHQEMAPITHWVFKALDDAKMTRVAAFEAISRRLIECFKPKTFTAHFHDIDSTPEGSVVLRCTKTLDKVTVVSRPWRPSFDLKQMQFVLGDTNAKEIEMFGVHENVCYRGPITTRHLTTGGRWLKVHNVLQMECRTLVVRESRLSTNDYNTILRVWCKGGLKDLEKLDFVNAVFASIDGIFHGFEGDPIVAKIRNDPKIKNVGFMIGRADGKVGEVFFDGTRFQFTVLQ